MSTKDSFEDYVFSLSKDDFELLKDSITKRNNMEKYRASSIEELALLKERPILCPACGSSDCIKDGHTANGTERYLCKECGHTFILVSKSIFNSMKIDFDILARYVQLMSFNLPLEAVEELCDVSHPTALLWRHKIFATVNEYQDKVWLRDRVWIDETYMADSSVLHEDGDIKKRGLSRQKVCIVVAIDIHKNIYAVVHGNGKPSAKRIYKALKDHIKPGSILIHDGDKAHNLLIEKLQLKSEVYIADTHSKEYLENMALINNLFSWLKRYLFRFIGMKKENLQAYLNWFVYLFRVKGNTEHWPKNERILRHLVLDSSRFTRG